LGNARFTITISKKGIELYIFSFWISYT